MSKIALWLTEREWDFLFTTRKLHSLTDSKTSREFPFGDIIRGALHYTEVAVESEIHKLDFLNMTADCEEFVTIDATIKRPNEVRKSILSFRDEEYNRSLNLGRFPKGNFIMVTDDFDNYIFQRLANILGVPLNKKKGLSEQEIIRRCLKFIYNSPVRHIEFVVYTFLGNHYKLSMRQICEMIRALSEIKRNRSRGTSEDIVVKLAQPYSDLDVFDKAKVDCPLVTNLIKMLNTDGFPMDYGKYHELKGQCWSSVEDFNLLSSIAEVKMMVEILMFPGKWIPEVAFSMTANPSLFNFVKKFWGSFMVLLTCGHR